MLEVVKCMHDNPRVMLCYVKIHVECVTLEPRSYDLKGIVIQ